MSALVPGQRRRRAYYEVMTDPVKDYISITISDLDGPVTLTLACSDALDDESVLSKVGGLLMEEVESGVISIDADSDCTGEAMLVLEDDGAGDIDMNIIFSPTVTVRGGELSGAQALALSALQRLQRRLGLKSMTLMNVLCEN